MFITYKSGDEYIIIRSPIRKVLCLILNTDISNLVAFKELRKHYSYYPLPDQSFEDSTWELFNSNFRLTDKFIKIPSSKLRVDELTNGKLNDFFIQLELDNQIVNIEVKQIDYDNKTIVFKLID